VEGLLLGETEGREVRKDGTEREREENPPRVNVSRINSAPSSQAVERCASPVRLRVDSLRR